MDIMIYLVIHKNCTFYHLISYFSLSKNSLQRKKLDYFGIKNNFVLYHQFKCVLIKYLTVIQSENLSAKRTQDKNTEQKITETQNRRSIGKSLMCHNIKCK